MTVKADQVYTICAKASQYLVTKKAKCMESCLYKKNDRVNHVTIGNKRNDCSIFGRYNQNQHNKNIYYGDTLPYLSPLLIQIQNTSTSTSILKNISIIFGAFHLVKMIIENNNSKLT